MVVPLSLRSTGTKNKEMEQERIKNATRRLLQHLDQGAQPSDEDFTGFGLSQETYTQGIELLHAELLAKQKLAQEMEKQQEKEVKEKSAEKTLKNISAVDEATDGVEKNGETIPKVVESHAARLGLSDVQIAEYEQHYNVGQYVTHAATIDAILPDVGQIAAHSEIQRIVELRCCLKNNGLACFLPDPLPSWLQYFGITRDAYLATLETETRRRTQHQTMEQGSASVSMHRSFIQQPSDDSERSAPMFRLHPPSPLAQDTEQGLLWQYNPFVTTWKGRVQEDSCMITVEANQRLQQEEVQSKKLEAERLQRSQDDLAEKERQFIVAQNAAMERKKVEELEKRK